VAIYVAQMVTLPQEVVGVKRDVGGERRYPFVYGTGINTGIVITIIIRISICTVKGTDIVSGISNNNGTCIGIGTFIDTGIITDSGIGTRTGNRTGSGTGIDSGTSISNGTGIGNGIVIGLGSRICSDNWYKY
jgi:hypothetical protein